MKDSASLPHWKLEEFCNALLIGIQNRGTDATGFAAFSPNDWNHPTVCKRPESASRFIVSRDTLPENTRLVLLHTRLATQGLPQFNGNNHPVRVKDWLVTHNGIIWNDNEIFEDLGIRAHSFVDTEAISAALSHYGIEKADKALEKCEGSLAIGAASVNHPMECILARGADSPLYVHETDSLIVWASTLDAIISAWKHAIGTPPCRNKPHYTAEGTLLRIVNGIVQRSRFTPERLYYESKWNGSGWKEVDDYCEFDDYCELYTPKEKEILSLPRGEKTETGNVHISCSYCQTLTPLREIETSFDGKMICEDCASFWGKGNLYATTEKCEYCGTTKNVLSDPSDEIICEVCLMEFLEN